jgi:MbtH protein
MSNPFDDETARFVVLVNEVPAGWTVVSGEDDRQSCLAYVEESWADTRPKSLAGAMAADEAARGVSGS